MVTVWKLPLVLPVLFYLFFLPIEATYLSSTLTKIPKGEARPLQTQTPESHSDVPRKSEYMFDDTNRGLAWQVAGSQS